MLPSKLKALCPKVKTPNGSEEYIVPASVYLQLLEAAIRTVSVDEKWYLSKYKDVAAKVSSKEIASGADHFCRWGYLEGRLPRKIVVDEDYYVKTNPDVANALARNEVQSAQLHFEIAGYKEGRLPFADFRLF